MLRVINDYEEIKKYQNELKSILKSKLNIETHNEIGFPSGSINETVYSNSSSNIWCSIADDLLDGTRFWNPFGIGNPTKKEHITPIVEINIPAYLDRRVGGVFLKDRDNNIYLGHRGKIGGGKPGVGKNAFFEKYSGKIIDAIDDSQTNSIAIISCIYDDNIINNIKRFLLAVCKIKNIDIEESSFLPEPTNIKSYIPQGTVTPIAEHAYVVNALAEFIEKEGKIPFNSKQVDLYTLDDNGNYETIYEVKSKIDTQSVYTAIGQVCYHSVLSDDVEKVIVLPKEIPRKIVHIINRLQIRVKKYKIVDEQVIFE